MVTASSIGLYGAFRVKRFLVPVFNVPIPMFDQRDHPSVRTMILARHRRGRRSRMEPSGHRRRRRPASLRSAPAGVTLAGLGGGPEWRTGRCSGRPAVPRRSARVRWIHGGRAIRQACIRSGAAGDHDASRNVSTILRQAYAQFRLGGSGFFCGGLIQTAVGLAGGSGGFRTKRLGLARKARLRVCCRAAWTSSACP
jgi:hypothetical protein